MAGEKAFSEANQCYIEEEFDEAERLFSQAIAADSAQSRYFLNRGLNRVKQGNHLGAVEDFKTCISKDESNAIAHQRLGETLFHLDEFDAAVRSFQAAQKLGRNCELWLRKCTAELKQEASSVSADTEPSAVESKQAATKRKTPTPAEAATATAPAAAAAAAAAPAPQVVKLREEWCQTTDRVMITLYVKGLKPEDVAVTLQSEDVTVRAHLPNGEDFSKSWQLFEPIDAQRSTHTVTKFKVEVTLYKTRAVDWDGLERKGAVAAPVEKRQNVVTSVGPPVYPYSGQKKMDWDALDREAAAEEEAEQPDGDAALSKLFQQIYKNATPETRRAMVKSYQTSGGTVLSTNWDEVAKKDYEKDGIEPPAGQEVRKWTP